MAIATKTKPKTSHQKKRVAAHHRHSKTYRKPYWPYLPMLLVVVVGLAISSFISHPRAVLGWQQNLNQEALLLETNNERRSNERQPLTLNQQLGQAAQAKADDMVHKNYWSHDSPGGKQPWQFVTDSGYQYLQAGENLAYGFTSAHGVLNGWMHSPDHKANVLETSYAEVGFGVAQSPDFMGKGSQTVIVAMYGLPTKDNPLSNSSEGVINRTDRSASISRVQAITPALSGLVVGAAGTFALMAVLLRHAIAWRKLFNRGEMFVIRHPWLDATFVAVVVAAVLLTQTAGFVR